MRTRVQIMGSIVQATPLPHRPLHSEYYTQMGHNVPGPGGPLKIWGEVTLGVRTDFGPELAEGWLGPNKF